MRWKAHDHTDRASFVRIGAGLDRVRALLGVSIYTSRRHLN